ncbi:hypothetical protein K2D_02920 [Planctomycetes bacterium K2D]|uniref:PEP-CTERM protein-sorting domain-containing protein n=1 Tax=Botrimarina mediterranea TaxID=2528022 RepID=A0A518K2Y3_9BACT|nr:hypothetical protein Spa11_03400 [Botrimarina mediterranea]QDV76711.1 hypothetical protein K2D_02920 [Planctomycetes bacterium K2D]
MRRQSLVVAAILLACGHAVASGGLRTVVLAGAPAPGTESVFDDFFQGRQGPTLNEQGRVSFLAFSSGPDSVCCGTGDTRSGWWRETPVSGLELVARSGDPAPGTDDRFAVWTQSSRPFFTESGDTAAYSFTGSNFRRGVWRRPEGGDLQRIFYEQSPLHELGLDVVFLGQPAADAQGGITIDASARPIGQPDAARVSTKLHWNPTDGYREVVRNGSPAPGTDQRFSETFSIPYQLGPTGRHLLWAMLDGPTAKSHGLWFEQAPGDLRLVARTDETAPGGGDFYDIARPGLGAVANGAGEVAFSASIGDSGGGAGERGIWREDPNDGLRLVVEQGDPTGEPGATFRSFRPTDMNSLGDMVFQAALSGPSTRGENTESIWLLRRGEVPQKLGRRFQALPTEDPNRNFLPEFFGTPVINERGQIAFGASTVTTGGLWATDPSGELRLIVRQGGLLDVSEDPSTPDLREVNLFGAILDRDGASGFNERGEVAFAARFTDGSQGIFVSSIAAIPEPASAGLGMLALALCSAADRRASRAQR